MLIKIISIILENLIQIKDRTTEQKFHFCLHRFGSAYYCTEQCIELESIFRFLSNYKARGGTLLTLAYSR